MHTTRAAAAAAILAATLAAAGCRATSKHSTAPSNTAIASVVTTESSTETVADSSTQAQPSIVPPEVAPASTPVVGTVIAEAASSDGYRIHAVLRIHRAVPLSAITDQLGSCTSMTRAWNQETAGALPVDLSAVDKTPGGFRVPDGDAVEIASGARTTGKAVMVTGNSTTNFSPGLCQEFGAAPSTTAHGFILVDSFRSPNAPNGDYAAIGSGVYLMTQKWTEDNMGFAPPPMPMTDCSGTGPVTGRVAADKLATDDGVAGCVLTFG